ncbi:hypothetical protein [Streptomyces sp. NPDC059063]|uniref:hypothetical protein n=1 Tax=unclassified Streptomyces TaxID=2593676 RepID=UPI0036B3E155
MKEMQGIRITTGNRETGAKAPVDALRPSKEALSSKKEILPILTRPDQPTKGILPIHTRPDQRG